MRRLWLLSFALVWLPAHLVFGEDPAPAPKDAASTALLLQINGPIGPAISHYISQGIKRAAEDGNSIVILRMDTPGGLDTSMRDIIKDILASPGAGGDLRLAERCACRQRGHVHPLREPHRRDGARHQSRFRHAGADRRRTCAAAGSSKKPADDKAGR